MDTTNLLNLIKTYFVLLGGILGTLLGGLDGFLYTLIVIVVIDYLTGVLVAILHKELSSTVGAKGIFRKAMIFVLVLIGNLIDEYILGSGAVVRTAVIFFYISNEGISILENASTLGLKIPKKLQNVLAQLQDKKDDDDKN